LPLERLEREVEEQFKDLKEVVPDCHLKDWKEFVLKNQGLETEPELERFKYVPQQVLDIQTLRKNNLKFLSQGE
jgi:hypothetical protein